MTDTDSNALVILVRLRAVAGREEEVAETISTQLALIREREPTCLAIAVHQSLEDPTRFMLHETWADAGSFEDFVTSRPYMLEYIERLTKLIEDREMTHWEVVG
jgi:quinol monooxygenase YgiN